MTSITDHSGDDDPLRELEREFDSGSVAVLEHEMQELEEDGDHDRFAHYVQKEKIMESAVNGTPVRALCGKIWTPGRDPSKFPVCPECKEIYERMRDE
ncbi:MAG: DUF3039 domain-containing protein [Pseudoclavibacter sp.]